MSNDIGDRSLIQHGGISSFVRYWIDWFCITDGIRITEKGRAGYEGGGAGLCGAGTMLFIVQDALNDALLCVRIAQLNCLKMKHNRFFCVHKPNAVR